MRRPIPLTNTGGLDKSNDPLYVRQGDYTDLRGMDFSEEAVFAQTTQAGNVKIIDFGIVSLQNQKTRINLPAPYFDEVTIAFKDLNGNTKGLTTVSTGATLSGVKSAIEAFLTGLPYGVTFQNTGTTIPYLDVTVNFAFADYIIEVTNATTDILEEAISNTGVGRYVPIGSYDYLDDIFYWLTTQRNLPSRLPEIQNVYSSVNSQVGINCPNHGLSNFDSVSIGSVVGVSGANGIFTITVIDANNFYLNNSFFSGTYVSGGIGFKDIYGYGCIGVVVEDTLQDNFSFTPLLRSKKLNFVTKKQIYTPQIQSSGSLIQMYYTDNNNVPRVTYYKGAYFTDGCIKALYPNTGQYAYATLSEEISRQINTGTYSLTIQDQLQVGGVIVAGNCRYAVRFLSESLAPSELSLLTPSIPTYEPAYDSAVPSVIYGSPSTVTTGKINRMLLDGFKAGVFKYVELIYFQYLGEGQTTATAAFVIRREVLSENQTSIVLEHNGNEPGITFFDPQLANQAQPNIRRSVDNVIIDNRLVDVAISTEAQVDLTEWVNTFTYSIKRFPLYGAFGAETNNEFYDPLNTVNHTSYQQYEWYRFYAAGRFKSSGALSNAFFMYDVRFVSQNDYTTNVDFQFLSTNGYSRRDFTGDEMINYDLGDTNQAYYQFGIEVKGIDWNFQIEGVPAKEIFSEICFFRAERISEVLSSGVVVMAMKSYSGGINEILDTPYAIKNDDLTGLPAPYAPYNGIDYTRRGYASFYSPDLLYSSASIEYRSGDKMVTFGNQLISQTIGAHSVSTTVDSYWRIFWGVTGTTDADITEIDSVTEAQTNVATPIEGSTLSYVKFATAVRRDGSFNDFSQVGRGQTSPVIKFATPVVNNSVNIDYGIYQSLYYRPIADKYGDKTSQLQVLYTGYSAAVNETSITVNGGDVFTQQMWLKSIYVKTNNPNKGGAGGFNVISQNRTNSNIRLWNSELTTNFVFPVSTQDFLVWLENPSVDITGQAVNNDQISKNAGYILRNNVQYQAVYDPEGQDNGQYGSRVTYSELKPNNSKVDYFRITLPLSFQDCPEIQGYITRALVLNKTLFVLQKRGFTHMYFNSQGTLASADSGQVLIGDGSVLQRIGTNLSEFGLAQSGAVVKGRSQSGKDTAMWVNSTFTNVLRFGDDGIRNISLRDNMRIFFNKYLRWANGADVPADGFGISGVWDNENSNYIFTVKAWKPYSTYESGKSYVQGAGAILGTIEQGVPQIWVATTNTDTEPSELNADWTKISIENPDYYSCFTFVYSEIKNKFTFYPYFLPNFYSAWKGRYLTAYSDLDSIQRSELYLHGEGNPNEFYGVTYDGGQVELVLNWQPDLNKRVIALNINANVKPIRVDIESLFRDNVNGETMRRSYLLEEDFYTREGYQIAQVKLDLDDTGSNQGNTSQMEGVWSKFRITFPSGVKCKLYDTIVFISDSTRNFTH